MSGTVALLVAAGASRRMGHAKQLIELEGKKLIQVVIERILGSGVDGLVVVLGAYADKIQGYCEGYGVDVVVHAGWEEGMGSSIRQGIMRVEELYAGAERVLVCPVDQPYVGVMDYRRLIEVAEVEGDKVVSAHYDGVMGVPMVFPRRWWGVLRVLEGDRGARDWIRGNGEWVVGVEMPEAGVDWDEESGK